MKKYRKVMTHNTEKWCKVCRKTDSWFQKWHKEFDEFKVELSPSKKKIFIYFSDSLSKIMKNAFYFILKALFVCKIFKFFSWLFGHVAKTVLLER